jgi:hypothetical protein
MARPSIWSDPFDRERTFVVRRPLRCAGRDYKAGEIFDKTRVSTRTLRQLFDCRRLGMADEDLVPELANGHAGNGNGDGSAGEADKPAGTGGGAGAPVVNWRTLPWLELRAHVHGVTGQWPASKAQAEALMSKGA